MSEQTTDNLYRVLNQIRSAEELNEYLAALQREQHLLSLSNYLNEIMHRKGLLLRNVVSESNLEQHYGLFS